MYVVKQGYRGAEGPDGSNDPAADQKDGDRREARASGEAEGAHSQEDGRLCPCGNTQEVPEVQIAQFLLQGPRHVWPPEMEVLLVWQDLLCKDKICPGYVKAHGRHMGRVCKGHAWQA